MKKTIYLLLILGFTASNIQAQNITVPKTQRGVVTKLAATWCPFCGAEAWDTYKKMVDDLSTKSLVMVAHRSTSSRLYSATAEKILNVYEPVFYQPYFFFNTKLIGEGDAKTSTEMQKQVDNFAVAGTPTAQTGLVVNYNTAKRELEVSAKTEFFKTATGEFYTGIYLIEKSVIAQQSNRGSMADHLNVLRSHFGTSEFGFEVGNGTMSSGFFKVTTTKYTLPTTILPENVIIASIIWQKNGNAYTMVNSNWTDQVKSVTVGVRENQELKAGFNVAPNVISNQAVLNFNLPKAGKQVLVQAYNVQGQVVATIFRGSLSAGKHQFQLNRQQLNSKGLYFVRLQVDGQFATRQVVVQ